MSGEYLLLKWLHIVSSTVLFGMGARIAFFFSRAQRTKLFSSRSGSTGRLGIGVGQEMTSNIALQGSASVRRHWE